MKIQTVFLLKWKSFIRHPLFEQTIFFRLLIGVYLFSLLGLIYLVGLFFDHFSNLLFPNETNPLKIFLFSILPLLLLDFVLKFFLKKNSAQFASIRRFPNSNHSILIYSILKEFCSFWNYYLLFFFFSYLTINIYQYCGFAITFISFAIVYFSQLLISLFVNYIHLNNVLYSSIPSRFSIKMLSSNTTINYLLLNIKMIIRSPRLRQQFLVYLLITIVYFYLIIKQETNYPFPLKLFFISFVFISFPITFNQFLFSAEAAFFDHLMTSPNFRKILQAKYILYLFFSFISFLVLVFLIPFNWESFVNLTAILLYSAGSITLLSFSGILFVNTKIDLFGSQYKMLTNPPSGQSFAILLIYTFLIALVILISVVFSNQVAVYFMFITGGISILLCESWFNYLYKCFYPNKYEKMEIFRIQ
jgi:hypothetical protein